MFRKSQLIALLFVLIFACAAQGSDWPRFLGPNGNATSSEKLTNRNWKAHPPKELWTINLTDDGFAGPSVANGKMFIIDHAVNEDIVRAVDIKTGKDVWTFRYADAVKNNLGFAASTPTFDNGKLYTLSRIGNLHCLDAETGTVIWKHNLRKDFQGLTGPWDYAWSPLIDGDKLILQPGGVNGVMALEKETGKVIWSGGGKDMCGYASVVPTVVEGKKEYIVFAATGLIGVDAEKGGPALWKVPWTTDTGINCATPVIVGPNSIFITSGYEMGCSLVTVKGGEATATPRSKDLRATFNTPVLIDGKIYGIGDKFGLVCLDPATGVAAWKKNGFEKGGLIAFDDVLLAISGGGDVVMVSIDPVAYKEICRFCPLGGPGWTAPIFSDGKLYIRNKVKLGCYELN